MKNGNGDTRDDRRKPWHEFWENVEQTVNEYIDSAPVFDFGINKVVTRKTHFLPLTDQAGIRLSVEVYHLDESSEREPGEYNDNWSQGLLLELHQVLQGHGFNTRHLDEDGRLVALLIFRS